MPASSAQRTSPLEGAVVASTTGAPRVLAQLRQLLAGLRLALVHEHCDVERLRVVAPGELHELEGVQRGHPLAQRRRRLAVTGEGDAEATISGHLSPR